MTLKNLTHEELTRHLEQAQIAQQEAIRSGDETVYRHAEALEEHVIAERVRRMQDRQDPDTEVITL